MAGAGEISRNLRFSLVFVPESKSNTHQNWDSWTRTSGMSESKSDALPLGYTPMTFRVYHIILKLSTIFCNFYYQN